MRKMMALILLSGAATLGGCATHNETAERAAVGAGVGAVAGAGVGAVAGGISPVEGAAVGAVAGGVIGAATTPSDSGASTGSYSSQPAYNGSPSYNDGSYTPTPTSTSTRRAGERG